MADLKISQLPVASTPLAGTELVPIVQGGTTDQTTVEAILKGTVPSGTANGVLFLNASKAVTSGSALTFTGTSLNLAGVDVSMATNFAVRWGQADIYGDTGFALVFRTTSLTEGMRLNSTGLGIGTSNPTGRLHVAFGTAAAAQAVTLQTTNTANGNGAIRWQNNLGTNQAFIGSFFNTGDTGNLEFGNGSTTNLQLSSSGNLGLGVTPSSQFTSYRAINLGSGTNNYFAISGNGNATCEGNLTWNARSTAVETFAYLFTGDNATRYRQQYDFKWYLAPSGTAGNAITFTQAMTLDSSGRLGIGVTNPSYRLDVVGSVSTAKLGKLAVKDDSPFITGANIDALGSSLGIGSTGANFISFFTNNLDRVRIDSAGNLGIGTINPGAKLHINTGGNAATGGILLQNGSNQQHFWYLSSNTVSAFEIGSSNGQWTWTNSNGEQMRLDASGNLGLGVTPSAWNTGYRALDMGSGALMGSPLAGQTDVYLLQNAYFGTPSNWYYRSTGIAPARYQMVAGAHVWLTAPSGTAGNAISFTQAMTLDANGNLGVAAPSSGARVEVVAGDYANIRLTRSQSTGDQRVAIGSQHYTNTEEPIFLIGGLATVSANRLFIGGASGLFNAATSIEFYVGANNTTTTGTQAMTLDANGRLGIGATSPTQLLHVRAANVAAQPTILVNEAVGSYEARLGVDNGNFGWVGTANATNFLIKTVGAQRIQIDISGNVVVSAAALATNATDGFLYVPTCAGTPTGTPTTYTGRSPIVVDTTNNKLYFYSGGQWRDAGP